MTTRLLGTSVAIAALLVAAPAVAQQSQTGQQQQQQAAQQQSGQLSQQDRQFVERAYSGNMLEVKLGEEAQQKAQSQEVQQFAQHMVEDHGKANETLRKISEDLEVEVPQQLPQDARQKIDQITQKQGQEFDKAYMALMVEAHTKDIQIFQQQARQGQNQELKSYAEETVSKLREHEQEARQVAQQVGAQVMAQGQQNQQNQQSAMQQLNQDDGTEVVVDQGGAQVQVDPKAPRVTVIDPEPRVIVETPKPQVSVDQPKPEVIVDQAEPEVNIQQRGQAEVRMIERDPQPEQAQQQSRTQPVELEQQSQVIEEPQDQQQAVIQPEQPAELQPDDDDPMLAEEQDRATTGPDAATLQGLIGSPAYDQAGEQIGEISDLVIGDNGQPESIVLERGGFLGIGDKEVLVNVQDIQPSQDGVVVNMTDEQISQLPDYDAPNQ